MPAPVNTPAAAPKVDALTHKVTLVNGGAFTLLDKSRPGNPWQFKNGVETKVPEAVALRLKETAVDRVTVTVGKKSSLRIEPKFQMARIGAPAKSAEGEGDES